MFDPIQQAAEYIQSETDKLGAVISYSACLMMARHLHHLWSGEPEIKHPVNIAQQQRQRYEGDAWDNGND